jgi:hypothetical protein
VFPQQAGAQLFFLSKFAESFLGSPPFIIPVGMNRTVREADRSLYPVPSLRISAEIHLHVTPIPNMALWCAQEQLCLTFIFKDTCKKFSCCLLSKRLRPHGISTPLCVLICIIRLSTYSMLTCVPLKNVFISNSSRSLHTRSTYLLCVD